MAKKGILLSDPSLQNMNATQWLFELEALTIQANRRYEDVTTLLNIGRKAAVDLLGLNLMPVEEVVPVEEGGGSDGEGGVITRLRPAEYHELTPLAILCAQPAISAEILQKYEEMQLQLDLDERESKGEVVHMTPEELDDFMAGDIEFPDDPDELRRHLIWNSPETKATLKSLVKPLSEAGGDTGNDSSLNVFRLQKLSKTKAKVKLD